MSLDWTEFLNRLHAYPPDIVTIRPPCSPVRVVTVEKEFEELPRALIDLVCCFNGAKLFRHCGALLRIFGISEDQPLSKFEWAEDWYIDKFTPKWRAAGAGRDSQFAIGMKNYGGVILFENGLIKEWDTAQREWSSSSYKLDDWLEIVLRDGDNFLREINGQ